MGVPEVERAFATFCCVACGYIFADSIPPICLDLPRCPICDDASWIDRILNYNQSGASD